jgi:hypothetical protein
MDCAFWQWPGTKLTLEATLFRGNTPGEDGKQQEEIGVSQSKAIDPPRGTESRNPG